MARCGCADPGCRCVIEEGAGINIDGTGTAEKPYRISADDSLGAIKTVSKPYTMTNKDRVLEVTGTTTVKLPKVGDAKGHMFTIVNIGTHTVTVSGNGALISGSSPRTLPSQWDRITVVSDGNKYLKISGT